MARYRKVDVRTYADEKFRGLSRPQPNGQSLWLYLLTGEETGPIPGLMRAGEAALAEQLGWPLADFRRCWREVQAAGMAEADWASRVVWLPKAIAYNEPENLNVVKGWRTTWDELPECPLKGKAWAAVEAYMVARDDLRQAEARSNGKPNPVGSFAETFRMSCPQPSRNGSGNGSGNGMAFQEQEQEQEQDRKTAAAKRASARRRQTQLGSEAGKPALPPPSPVALASEPASRDPGTAGPGEVAPGSASDLNPGPAAPGHPAEAATPSTPQRPVLRAAPPVVDDVPVRPLVIRDASELMEGGAELRARLEERNPGWRPKVAAQERLAAVRMDLEAMIETLGVDRCFGICQAIVERRKSQGLGLPVVLAFFLAPLHEAAEGGDPEPVAIAGVDVNQVLAQQDADVERRWAPLLARLTPSQLETYQAEKARVAREIRQQGLWTSEETRQLQQAEGWLFEKWSRKAASGEA